MTSHKKRSCDHVDGDTGERERERDWRNEGVRKRG